MDETLVSDGGKSPDAGMHMELFDEFLASQDTLRIYWRDKRLFVSRKGRIAPLLEYLEQRSAGPEGVVIFDTIVGNAAALLSVKAGCAEVYSPLGSDFAVATLDKYRVRYHFLKIVPFIQTPAGDMCPLEKLSVGKDPDEFLEAVRNHLAAGENTDR